MEGKKPIVVLGIVKYNGKLLIVERKNKEKGLTWVFPGGEVSGGETPEEAVRREVLEETGLSLGSIKEIFERIHPASKKLVKYFDCFCESPKIEISSEEILTAEWCDPTECLHRFTSEPAEEIKTFMFK